MRLYIKNMVCGRCISAVKQLVERTGLDLQDIALGEVELKKAPTDQQRSDLRSQLSELGFELLDDQKQKMISQIKTLIIEHVHYKQEDARLKLSELLTSKLHKDYSYLSHLFSEVEGITIERYYIDQKIEKVKELLVYDELSLNQIAFDLGYSSVAHLSSQFKKVTGLTPTHFKKLGGIHRKTIDKV